MESHLKSTYGFNNFRQYQKAIIEDLLNGENTFAILPTGGGKSLLYQFPATYTGKLTIVVSPLISLMNDQCNYLNSKNINSACLNSESSIDIGEYKNYKIIYTTPEFMEKHISRFEQIRGNIGLFAIDEAHCVSQWSHDFRESYLKLGIIKTTFPDIPMLAVTATATPRVVNDIYEMLNIYEAGEYALGTRRTNLEINIYRKREFDLCEFTVPTIVYVQTRKVCESVCDKLLSKGVRCAYYHGGMLKADKERSHARFTSGDIMVIVATISFGMGIDKSDIRHVINYGVPSDIETYYQEIGRAGRDGLPSKASLYYDPKDFSTTMFLIKQSEDPKQVALKTTAMNTFRNFLEENNICRQQIIDYYFQHGEYPTEDDIVDIPKCNMCDNCSGGNKLDMTDISEEAKTAFQIINTQHTTKGFTYGMEKTVNMIKNTDNAIFKTMTKTRIKELLEILIAKNILNRVTQGNYFVICIGKKDITTMLPITARIKKDTVTPFKPKLSTSETRIRDIRTEIAKRHGIIPSILINDRVMMNICNSAPKDITQLWKVDGISDEFIMNFGAEFIDECQKNVGGGNSTCKGGGVKDITCKHYKEGKTIREISDLTGRTRRTIEDHLIHIFENYDDVDIDTDYFGLTEEMIQEINDAVKQVGSGYLKPIKDIVNNKITYAQIKLAIMISK